jgi:hypothetical protein
MIHLLFWDNKIQRNLFPLVFATRNLNIIQHMQNNIVINILQRSDYTYTSMYNIHMYFNMKHWIMTTDRIYGSVWFLH